MIASIRHRHFGLALATLLAACLVPEVAFAADGDQQDVECKLPGEIRSVGGHSMMGAGRIVRTSPDDCRQRGGEYTVQEAAPATPSPAMASATDDDGRMVSCLLPAQTRQLGEKARYRTTRATIHTTRTDCHERGGSVYTPRKSRTHKKA